MVITLTHVVIQLYIFAHWLEELSDIIITYSKAYPCVVALLPFVCLHVVMHQETERHLLLALVHLMMISLIIWHHFLLVIIKVFFVPFFVIQVVFS